VDDGGWGVSAALFGSANFAVYTALQPRSHHGLGLPSGHDDFTVFQTKKVSATSVYFENACRMWCVTGTGLIDYDDMWNDAPACSCKEALLIWRIRTPQGIGCMQDCRCSRAKLMVDMAHVSGLVAGKQAARSLNTPIFGTSLPHKTLQVLDRE
jgi:glycine hydroxymethyltransferase